MSQIVVDASVEQPGRNIHFGDPSFEATGRVARPRASELSGCWFDGVEQGLNEGKSVLYHFIPQTLHGTAINAAPLTPQTTPM